MLGLDRPDQGTIQQIFQSTAAWTAVFTTLNALLLRQRSLGFNNRAVSLLHALVALTLCPAALNWQHPFSGYGQKTTDYQRFVMNISLGYFTYDMLCCLYIDLDFANVAHHLCTTLGLAVGVCNGVSGTELTFCLLLMEVSNPFLHGRFLLKELGWKQTHLSVINDLAFAISFFVCRLLIGPVVVYYTLVCPSSPTIVKVGGIGIQVVSLFWFYKIAQIAIGKTSKQRSKGHKLQ
ncbi:hypothetical protein ABBQ38_003483 [Trebouxia sp. C0009 RCD-2024]